MVTTTAPSIQAHYESDKKKKHSLEKAKVAHLTRQLQLRLQYAKLKVDHGWQRQNLNEVENLFFHHSHMRMPRLLPTQFPASVVNTATMESNIDPRGAQTNVMQTDSNGADQAGPAALTLSPDHQSITAAADLPPAQQHYESPGLMPSNFTTNVPSSPSHQHQSESFTNLLQVLANSCKTPAPTTQPTKSPLRPRTPSSVPFTSNNSPKTPNKSSTSHLFPSSTSNSALTYDSFWSNHNSSRPFRSSFLGLLSSTDPEVNKTTAQALLSGLSGKNISSYLNNSSNFMASTSCPPTETTSPLTPMTRRNLPTVTEASEGG